VCSSDLLNSRYTLTGNITTYLELIMCAFMLLGTLIALRVFPVVAPYLALSAASYGVVGGWGLSDRWRVRRTRRECETVSD
jgi:hypothetical protein